MIVNRGIDRTQAVTGRDLDYATLRAKHFSRARCRSYGSSRASLRTSSTRPARPASPKACSATPAVMPLRSPRACGTSIAAKPGETMFTTSDIGWVVGHSYIVYGPLIHGMATVMYEGLPIRPDPGIWWKIVAEHTRSR